jgi:hypothetical protein
MSHALARAATAPPSDEDRAHCQTVGHDIDNLLTRSRRGRIIGGVPVVLRWVEECPRCLSRRAVWPIDERTGTTAPASRWVPSE